MNTKTFEATPVALSSARAAGFDARYTFNESENSCPYKHPQWRAAWLEGFREAEGKRWSNLFAYRVN